MIKQFTIPDLSGSRVNPPSSLKIITSHPIYNQQKDLDTKSLPKMQPETANSLPAELSSDDVREVIKLLKRKPEGVKITKALLETHKRIFEAKKILSFVKLNIIEGKDQLFRLSALGWKFAENLRGETEMFRTLILHTKEYQEALKWICETKTNEINTDELCSFWNQSNSKEKNDEYKEFAITFFHLCQAADFGTMTLGKKGRITRLLMDSQETQKFVAHNLDNHKTNSLNSPIEFSFPPENPSQINFYSHQSADVLVISQNNQKLVQQLETAFDLANISFQTIKHNKADDLKHDEKTYQAFNSSLVGCYVIGKNEVEKDSSTQNLRLTESVLCDIGAALFGFRSRLIIVSGLEFDLPERLKNIPSFQINRNEISLEIAHKLIDKIKELRFQTN